MCLFPYCLNFLCPSIWKRKQMDNFLCLLEFECAKKLKAHSQAIPVGSDNGSSPGWRQAIIWNNTGILLIQSLGPNFSEILSKIHTFSFMKMHWKMMSVIWLQFGFSLNVLTLIESSNTAQSYFQFQDHCYQYVYHIGMNIVIQYFCIIAINMIWFQTIKQADIVYHVTSFTKSEILQNSSLSS